MNYNLPDKTQNAGHNTIRATMMKAATVPNCISFGIGNPAPEAIPSNQIVEAISEIIASNPMRIFQYGMGRGYQPLLDFTEKHLVEDLGINPEGNMLSILSGSGHGLGLIPRTICNEGDIVFADEFTFPNGVAAARNAGCIVKSVKMDSEGMIPSELEKVAKEGKGRYIYLIPNFQNPTGLTMPLQRRKDIYEIAQKYDLIIYEDDPYGEIRFSGEKVPSFKSFDTDGRVIFAGSYSKVLSAGLRVGYLYANEKLLELVDAVKSTSDGGTPWLTQMAVYHTLEKVDYKAYIQNICDIYGRKCKVMTDALDEYCSKKVTYKKPEGGMFLWLEIPEDADSELFFDKCLENRVCIIPAQAFQTDLSKGKNNAFRLNYTAMDDEKIIEGIKLLGEVSHTFFKD